MADSDTKIGRPTVMTPEVLDKFRLAFLIGATNLEAATYAGVTEKTLYNYIEKNPDFVQQIEAWKHEPILKSKQTVVSQLGDLKNAQWYLERKAPDFRPKSEVAVDDSLIQTRDKIKEFLDDPDDYQSDAPSSEPAATDSAEARGEVESAPTDIS